MSEFWWYVTRSSGLVAWALFTASLVLGMAASTRLPSRPALHRWILDLHPWVSGTALGALVLHVVAIVADSYVEVSLVEALVPFASGYDTTGVALGAIALWLLVAVQATAAARRRLSRRTWRGIHLGSYLAAVLMTVHAFVSGTDTDLPLVRAVLVGASGSAIVFAVGRAVVRLGKGGTRPAASPGGGTVRG